MSKGLYGSFPLATFNSKLAVKEVHRECIRLLKNAVKAWVVSATESTNNIPVWSGMARGSVMNVGKLVGYNVSVFSRGGRVPNRVSEGASQSTQRLVIIPGRYGFEWSSNVQHLEFNDQNDANAFGFHLTHTPRPWDFKINADAAFISEMDKGLKSFPFTKILGKSVKITNKRI